MLNIKELVEATNGILVNGDYEVKPKNYEIDSRLIESGDFFIPILGEKVDGHKYIIDTVKKGAIGFFISNGFSERNEIVQEAININKSICIIEVNDTKLALVNAGKYNRNKHIKTPIVAVTGSVGKTSTREMIASILKTEKKVLVTRKNYNSNIGVPIMCLEIDDQDVCVLEAGIDKFGEMAELSEILQPDIVVYTMIGTSHIGTFKTKENIFEEKSKLMNNIKGISKVIINGDDIYLSTLSSDDKINVESYTIDTVGNVKSFEDSIKFVTRIYGKEEVITINEIGNHNIYNALCAIKVGETFNIKTSNIIKGIAKYENFNRRLQKEEIDGIILIDDTYNASPESMKSGLMTVNKLESKRKFAIIGDIFDLGELSQEVHSKISEVFSIVDYDFLYTLGEQSKLIANGAKEYINENNIKSFDRMNDLVDEIVSKVKKGDMLYFKASNGMNFNILLNNVKKALKNKE